MAIAKRLREILDDKKVQYLVISHSPAYSALELAQALHVSGKMFAKSVICKTPDGFLMAVLEAPHRVDLQQLKELTGEPKLRLATEDEFKDAFSDCELGAMPPFGNLYGLQVYVDQKLEEDEEIVFNAGTFREAIRMCYADFKKLVEPTVGSFADVDRY